MIQRLIINSLILVLLVSCSTTKENSTNIKNEPEFTSIISIIANPQRYHNKNIVIDGYFVLKKEGDAIYLTKTDFENGLFKNAIYLFVTYKDMEKFDIDPPYKGYVKIEGEYDMNNKGSYNFFSGSIINIKNISRLYKVGGVGEEYNME